MRGPLWSADDDEDIRRLYVDPSVTCDELVRRFGRSWMAIKSRANKFGLYRRSPRPLSSRPWTEEEEQLLRELYPDLNTPREEIARCLGRTWRSIQHRIGQLGISDTRERNNPCQVRRDYFKVIDSDEKAYWLGFIAADGYVFIGGRQHCLRMVGTLPFLTVVATYIRQVCNVYLHDPILRSNQTYVLFASGKRVLVIDRALNASGRGLSRKHITQTVPSPPD